MAIHEADMGHYDDFLDLNEVVWIPKYVPTPPCRSPDTSDDSEKEDAGDLRKKRIKTEYGRLPRL